LTDVIHWKNTGLEIGNVLPLSRFMSYGTRGFFHILWFLLLDNAGSGPDRKEDDSLW
jgi:hypothetical protein